MSPLVLSLVGLLSTVSHAAQPELCDKAVRLGWRAGADGTLFQPWYLKPSMQLDPASIDGLERFIQAIRAQDITPVVVLLPTPALTSPTAQAAIGADADWSLVEMEASHQATLRWLRSNGAVVISALDVARAQQGEEPFFFLRDHHWTPEGSRATAQAVADVLRNHEQWSTVPHRTFATKTVKEIALEGGGSAGKSLQKRCGIELPDVTMPYYETRPTAPLQLGLLDEAPADPVVVLGSSYSMTKFNFSGFLQEYSELPVLNLAVSGGRVMGAPLQYFSSDDYASAPPTWVVWEMASTVEALPDNGATPAMNAIDTWRELVPAVHGRCESPVLEGTAPLAPGDQALLDGPASGPAAGGHYLVLDPSDQTPGPLTVVTQFSDGTTDRFVLGRYTRVESRGAHFLEMPLHQTARIDTVRIEATDAASGEVAYQLCAY